MQNTEQDILLVVRDFQKSTITESTLHLMRRIVEQGLSSQLVAQITYVGTKPDQDLTQAISKTMANLETIAETDRSLACILMAELWGRASDTTMHEVCDAIDLWLHDSDSVELYRHLRKLASSELDPDKRRHFEQLVEMRSG